MRVGAVRWMQMHFTVLRVINPSLRCTAPRKVEGQMGRTFICAFFFLNAGEIKTFFAEAMRFI